MDTAESNGPAAPALVKGDLFAQLLKRPSVAIEAMLPGILPRLTATEFAPWVAAIHTANGKLPAWVRNEWKTVETGIKFAGYLAQQQRAMVRLRNDESREIPAWFDYARVSGLSREMTEKLTRVRPRNAGTGKPHRRRDTRSVLADSVLPGNLDERSAAPHGLVAGLRARRGACASC